jgi:glycosyltransferase involved in cell wall biosynthesis
MVNNFSYNTKSLYKMYFVDTSNKFQDFIMNIKIILKIYLENPRYFVCFSDYGNERFSPSVSVLYLISKFKLSKMMLISPDSVWKINILRARMFKKKQLIYYGDRNLLIYKNFKKRMCPVNISKDFFSKSKSETKNKTIDVLYIGRIKGMKERIDSLKKINEIIDIKIIDTDENHLAISEYIKIISNSKIVINFNAAKNGKIHFKGKSLEIIACSSLLFEPENSYLKKNFLKPGEHYVSYRSIEDLIEKINYYKINPEELRRISENGRNELFKLFEKRSIWKYLLNNTK